MVPNAIKNDVETLAAFGEILLGVINGLIRADGSDHVHIPCTTYAGHMRAESLRDLHCERTDASCRAVNQDPLPWLNSSLVAKSLQGSECGHRGGSSLLKRYIVWFDDQR